MRKYRGILFLWVAMLIFAAANSVIAKLGLLGAMHPIHGKNPISFCNVLFTANLIASIVLFALYQKTWRSSTIKKVPAKQWIYIFCLALFSGVLGPTFFFLSLMLTQVINVVLISVLDIPFALLFGWLFIKEKPSIGTLIGALLALTGVVITFLLHQPPADMHMKMMKLNVGTGAFAHFLATLPKAGEIMAVLGVFFTTVPLILSKNIMSTVPIGIFSVFRMVVGTVVFFTVVISVFGWGHFADIFSPFLWEWMLLYGGVIIAFGLWIWFEGIKDTTSSDLAISNSFNPIAGVFFAFLILREIPERGQIIGGIVILLGIAVALLEKLFRKKDVLPIQRPRGFTGV